MARRGGRKKLFKDEPNIYQDATGYAVIVRVAGAPDEHRFPFGTPPEQLIDTRDRLKKKARGQERARVGTLAADVVDYLKTIADDRKRKDAANLCRHWLLDHGRQSRFALTRLKIEQQLTTWQRAGAAASTCNKRLTALRGVFNALNDDTDPNPAARVKKLPEPPAEPRAIDYSLITRILAAMPDRGRPTGKGKGTRPTVSLTKLRLALMAYTGLPPAQIARINPATDIDWDGQVLRARPRRKGKGTKEAWLPLQPQAIDVLRELVAKKALKTFSTSSAYKSWQCACVHVIREQLEDREAHPLPHRLVQRGDALVIVALVSPYWLRHSYLTRALRSSGNLRGVQHLAQHASSRQTDRYTEAAVTEAARSTVAQMKGSLPETAVPAHVKRPTKAKVMAPAT